METNKYSPHLRFPCFSGAWTSKAISSVGDVITGSTPDTSVREFYDGGIPFYSPGDIPIDGGQVYKTAKTLSEAGLCQVRAIPPGATLFVCIGSTIGKVAQAARRGATNQQINTVVAKSGVDGDFLYFALSRISPKIQELTAVQAVPIVNKTTFSREKIFVPLAGEQKKIAEFLLTIDGKIALIEKKKALLEEYKRGCVQGLHSQKIRFKTKDGKLYPDWKEKPLHTILVETKNKSDGNEPVYSVSVHKGLINQIEHLGRSFSAAETGHYNRVEPGDIVYTKSPTGEFPYGIVKQSRLEGNVIVSPLYGVFRPETTWLGYWLHVYFESFVNTNNYLKPIIQKGAKNTINITNNVFLSARLMVPVVAEEQRKVAEFLSTVDRKISLVNIELEKAKTFKKGLLQQMFI